jgi:lipoate-protein ligase A
MESWFLLNEDGAPGAENMARDEFLLTAAEARGGPPVLRLYRFTPPAITIGFHQDPAKALDLYSVRGSGIDVVRRITGGRALLHDGELTYAVAAPNDNHALGSGLRETCGRISEAIVAALRAVGVGAELSAGHSGYREEGLASPCLASASRYEITAGGKKIAGSAQRRTAAAFLQHGSILLAPASGGIVRFLKGDWKPLDGLITSVAEELEGGIGENALRSAIVEAFAEHFQISWRSFETTADDRRKIADTARLKREEMSGVLGREVQGR